MSQPTPGIEATLHNIAEQITANSLPLEDRLWTAQDIGDYMQLSEFTISRKVASQPNFPDPIKPTGSSRRWFAGEVIEWARVNRARMPQGRNRRR